MIMSVICLIITEAAGMDSKPMMYGAHARQRRAAWLVTTLRHCYKTKIKRVTTFRSNRSGLLVLVPLNIGAWLIGAMAVHYFNLALFSVTFILNICLSVAIFTFHTLGSPKVYFK